MSNFSVSTLSRWSSASALPQLRKSSSWHSTTYPCSLWVNVIGTTITASHPAASIVSVTSLPQHLLASRVPYMAFSARQPTPGGASPLAGTITTLPDVVSTNEASVPSSMVLC